MKEFFERDLTDAEEDELGRQLASSPKNSMRFAKQAKIFYSRTGLPRVARPWHSRLGLDGGTMTLKIVGSVIAGSAMVVTALYLTHKPAVKPISAPVPTAVSAPTPLATRAVAPQAPVPTRSVAQAPVLGAMQKPNMVKPLAYDPSAKYEGLDLIVERKTPGIVTVRVLDSAKKEVRLLFAGFLDQGKWTFEWDGKLSNKDYAQAGVYSVEVQSGKEVLAKQITLQNEAVANKP